MSIYIFTDHFLVDNQENFQTNLTVYNIVKRNKDHFHRPISNLPSFQKSAFHCGIRIFNSLPHSLTNLKNAKSKFKAILKMYLNTHFFYSIDKFLMCTDDL